MPPNPYFSGLSEQYATSPQSYYSPSPSYPGSHPQQQQQQQPQSYFFSSSHQPPPPPPPSIQPPYGLGLGFPSPRLPLPAPGPPLSRSSSSPSPTPSSHNPYFSPPLSQHPPLPQLQQLKSKLGHATTPSFVPPSFRRPQLTVRPPSISVTVGGIGILPGSPRLSPRVSRGPSPSLSATGNQSFREQMLEKKRKVVVEVPLEGNIEQEEEGERKKSIFSPRTPLSSFDILHKLEEIERNSILFAIAEEDLVTRERHFDEEPVEELMESIDIYLPGQDGWDDLRDQLREELGLPAVLLERRPSPSSFPLPPSPSTPLPPLPTSHNRTLSLYNSLPPRLQHAYESRGHASSFSLSGPPGTLSHLLAGVAGVGRNFLTSPTTARSLMSWKEEPTSIPSTQGAIEPPTPSVSKGLSPGSLSTTIASPSSSITSTIPPPLPSSPPKPTVEELGRGFGLRMGLEMLGVPAKKRQSSLLSTATGIASASDDISDADEDDEDSEVEVEGEREKKGHKKLESSLTEALGPGPSVLVKKTSNLLLGGEDKTVEEPEELEEVVEPGYEGSEESSQDSGEEASSELEGREDEEEEFSNPSDEERVRGIRMSASRVMLRGVPNPDNWIEGVEERSGGRGEILFEAPKDVEELPVGLNVELSKLPTPSTPNSVSVIGRRPLPTPPTSSRPTSISAMDQILSSSTTTHRFIPPDIPLSSSTRSIETTSTNDSKTRSFISMSSSPSSKSLNVAAPEFVFGGGSVPIPPPPSTSKPLPQPLLSDEVQYSTIPPSLSTTSLNSAGFSVLGVGAPGSLATSSTPASPTKKHLNPFAGEFKPTFDFKLPTGAPTFVPVLPTTSTSSMPTKPDREGVSASPLPTSSSTTTPHTAYTPKRQKIAEVEDDSPAPPPPLAPFTSPGKDNMRVFKFPPGPSDSPPPLGPLPPPPPTSAPSSTTTRVYSRQGATPSIEGSRSFVSVDCDLHDHSHTPSPSLSDDQPLSQLSRTEKFGALDNDVPQPLVYGTLGRTAGVIASQQRPFTISQAIPAVSPDGRVIGFGLPTLGGGGRRLPIPNFGGVEEGGKGKEREEPRRKSTDDIAIPSKSRPMSHAIPIVQRRVTEGGGFGHRADLSRVADWDGAEDQDEVEDDVFTSDDKIPQSPLTSHTRSDSGSRLTADADDEDEEDDSPLRILETIIDRQFDSLRQELSGLTSLKADLDSLKHDALVDSLAARMEDVIKISRGVDGEKIEQVIKEVRKDADLRHATLQKELVGALKELSVGHGESKEGIDRLLELQKAVVVASPAAVWTSPSFSDEGVAALVIANIEDRLSKLPTSTSASIDEEALILRLSKELQSLLESQKPVTSNSVELGEPILEHLRALQDGHEKISERTLEVVESHAGLKEKIGDIQREFGEKLDERLKLEAVVAEKVTEIAELETQLAKAGNEHGKARTEKAVVTQRLEDDKLTYTTELEDLKSQLKTLEEASRKSEIDQALAQQTISRLEEDAKSANTRVEELEAKLAHSRDQQDAWHATELQHISALGENQVKARMIEDDLGRVSQELHETKQANEGLVQRVQEEREANAQLRGELLASEKRLTSQDEKLANLQRANASKQQSLALANQRSGELEKRTAEVEASRAEMASSLEDSETRLAQSEAASAQLRQEVEAYRAQMTTDLEAMQAAVREEQEQAQKELEDLRADNERLQQRNIELTTALEKSRTPPPVVTNDYLSSPLVPIQRPQTAQPTLRRQQSLSPASAYPPTPPTTYPGDENTTMYAPRTEYGYEQPSILQRQHTGSTVVRPSSSATNRSRTHKTPVKLDDGWWE